jgi:hypothetical protein
MRIAWLYALLAVVFTVYYTLATVSPGVWCAMKRHIEATMPCFYAQF